MANGFAPPVKNLTDDGFPLFGGRIDHMDTAPSPHWLHRQQHYINLYIWPSTDEKNQVYLRARATMWFTGHVMA